MAPIQVLIIPADTCEPIFLAIVNQSLASFQHLVDGYIEKVPGGEIDGITDPWHAYVNEEGKIMNLPINPRATELMHRIGSIFSHDSINGTMVIVGEGIEGGYADAPNLLPNELPRAPVDLLHLRFDS